MRNKLVSEEDSYLTPITAYRCCWCREFSELDLKAVHCFHWVSTSEILIFAADKQQRCCSQSALISCWAKELLSPLKNEIPDTHRGVQANHNGSLEVAMHPVSVLSAINVLSSKLVSYLTSTDSHHVSHSSLTNTKHAPTPIVLKSTSDTVRNHNSPGPCWPSPPLGNVLNLSVCADVHETPTDSSQSKFRV